MASTLNTKIPALVGAGAGLVAFLFLGLLPGLYYGGYAGVLLSSGIFGAQATGVGPSALIIFGAVLGVTALGSLFAVAGAVVGAGAGALLGIAPRTKRVDADRA